MREYAALGVLGAGPERRLRTFIHHGMTTSRSPRSATCPTGHGAARADHRPSRAAAAARHRRAPRVVRLPAEPPADELVPGRPGADPRPGLRQPLPHREAGRWRLHRRATRASSSRWPRRPVSRSRTPASTRRRPSARPGWRRPRRSSAMLSADRAGRGSPADGRRPGPRGGRGGRRLDRVGQRPRPTLSLRVVSGYDAGITRLELRSVPRPLAGPRGGRDRASRSRSRTSPTDPRALDVSRPARVAAAGPGDRRAAGCRAGSGKERWRWPGRWTARRSTARSTRSLPASFAEQAALALQVDAVARGPASDWPCSRTGTGSVATCTTW